MGLSWAEISLRLNSQELPELFDRKTSVLHDTAHGVSVDGVVARDVRIAPLGGAEPQGSWALHCHFYFTDVRILRLLPDDSHILLNRGADILESLILGLALRPATREPGHSYQIWYRATVGRSNTAALPGFVSSTHRWSDETRERTSSP